MATVFQQIIKDTITAIPKGSDDTKITKLNRNSGLCVKRAATYAELCSSSADTILGILGDYDKDENEIVVIRKGRCVVRSDYAFNSAVHIGQEVMPSGENNGCVVHTQSGGVGEILGGGVHEIISHYFIVDLDLPIGLGRKSKPRNLRVTTHFNQYTLAWNHPPGEECVDYETRSSWDPAIVGNRDDAEDNIDDLRDAIFHDDDDVVTSLDYLEIRSVYADGRRSYWARIYVSESS